MSGDILVGLMTAPDRETAADIVDRLVEEELIACGSFTADVTSVYRWQGSVERATEILVIMKTTVAQAARVIRRVRDLHPYEVPEVLFFPVTIGHEAYMQWVRESVPWARDTSDDATEEQS